MAPYSGRIVDAGIRHGVDPRVVVAIAGVESSFGVHAPGFNAWGWDSGRARWKSWPQAIDKYTERLSSAYTALRTGHFKRVSSTYCPPCGSRWGVLASYIFGLI